MSIIKKQKLIIAGPCSAESEKQMLQTAKELKQVDFIDILRAGIWKPRTKPGGYEGAGEQGLKWLSKAKEVTGLPIAIEIAKPHHIELALKYGVDIVWIGARSTANPFSIQELSDELKNAPVEVLIKNPINADINLWIGAYERIKMANVKEIGFIHRGFTSFGNAEYRNAPFWQIPIEMKRLYPNIPMICDPSHIGGKRSRLQKIIQKSINLDYNGIMVESHCNPKVALTDSSQQIKPSDFMLLMNQIEWKKNSTDKKEYKDELETLREQIKELDNELISIFGARMQISNDIGKLKQENNLTILQTQYWDKRLNHLLQAAKKYDLNTSFVKTILEFIHLESIRIQNETKIKKK